MTERAEPTFWERQELPAPYTAMDVSAFDALPPTLIPMEYINGRVIYPHWNEASMSPTPTPDRQRLAKRLTVLLSQYENGGELFAAPMEIWLGDARPQPDLFWIAADNTACVEKATHFEGPPDLAIEIVSGGNVKHDRVTKYTLYEQHGIREYWIVDGEAAHVDVYTLHDGAYHHLGTVGASGSFVSPVLGKTVQLSAVFKRARG